MGTVAGLLLGVGLCLILWAVTSPPPVRQRSRWALELADLLVQAGVPGVRRAAAAAFAWDDKILIEPFVPAREIECSVPGNERPEAYTPGEVAPTHEFYDYEAKYVDPNGAALLIPAELDENGLRTVREIAVKAYRVAELTGLARVDFFVRKDTGEILLNEVNTMPGFTTISMFPKMCEASGLAYAPLLDKLIDLAMDRARKRESRDYSRKPDQDK